MIEFLDNIKKFVRKLINQILLRIPSFQQNLALPSDGIFGKLVGSIFTSSNGPVIQEILRNHLKKELSSFPKNSSYLELGFGPGIAMEAVLQDYPNFTTMEGVDPSPEMHAVCMENLKESKKEVTINLKEGFGHDMPHIKDGSIDFLFHANVIYFVDDMDKTLQELRRVLKPKTGLMASMTTFKVASSPSFDKTIFKNTSQEDYVEALKRNGFDVLREEDLVVHDFPREMILVKRKQ